MGSLFDGVYSQWGNRFLPMQRRIYNLVENVRWSYLQKYLTDKSKISIVDSDWVLNYASVLPPC